MSDMSASPSFGVPAGEPLGDRGRSVLLGPLRTELHPAQKRLLSPPLPAQVLWLLTSYGLACLGGGIDWWSGSMLEAGAFVLLAWGLARFLFPRLVLGRDIAFAVLLVSGALAIPDGALGGRFLAVLLGSYALTGSLAALVRRTQPRARHGGDRRLCIVGAGPEGRAVARAIVDRPGLGVEIVGFLDDGIASSDEVRAAFLGGLNDFEDLLTNDNVSEVVLALPDERSNEVERCARAAAAAGKRPHMLANHGLGQGALPVRAYRLGNVLLHSARVPLDNPWKRRLKRVFDVTFSLTALLVTSPLLFLLAIAIVIDSRGRVLYTPYRLGYGGKPFKCYKFRTMVECEGVHPTSSTSQDDPRVTRLGRYLRKSSLDELPQFLNVLRGEMSVVGPRPHRVALNMQLRDEVPGYMERHYVRPGITGLAQVNGWRGPTETMRQKTERTRLDLWYVSNWTFWLDLKIIFRTVFGRRTHRDAF